MEFWLLLIWSRTHSVPAIWSPTIGPEEQKVLAHWSPWTFGPQKLLVVSKSGLKHFFNVISKVDHQMSGCQKILKRVKPLLESINKLAWGPFSMGTKCLGTVCS